MKSALYLGTVVHARSGPVKHRFRYSLPWFLIDLDEISEMRWGWLFNVNRAALMSYHDADHGARDGSAFRDWLKKKLASEAVSAERFRVLAMPRFFGYVFNPISIVYCYERDDAPVAVIYEVHSTFGESHCYVHRFSNGVITPHQEEKRLHVSPFFSMRGKYRFRVTLPTDSVSIGIRFLESTGHQLFAAFQGNRQPLTRKRLWMTMLTAPLATLGITAAIHWEALKLWCKGVSLVPHPRKQQSNNTRDVRHV
ncbi:MAG: hypothetical protein CBB92_04905 [Flammeovirgaceae bacterium TMED32]|nr:DUF1365 domain-containing protein [Gammaproteobacteria bacterium]OUT99853.1 MAG: hypothetical protein CBB92_04905 [Flammeovirgaceae bacterium TMED32]RPG23362.1 MAG: DUF1365 domain-containing protein [Gammaproteobacteria bacterium TMED50]